MLGDWWCLHVRDQCRYGNVLIPLVKRKDLAHSSAPNIQGVESHQSLVQLMRSLESHNCNLRMEHEIQSLDARILCRLIVTSSV
ncbi:hypothetical protein TIFTF001_023603 [Ficus carica]|uniref:Uncharacterized protein n=1 Tax=Ficus carica TaxID=3494 RepID=A0AA88DCJ9_FICCA|nr:hypothetical protein TIFTF001_023603 [Ficus carica]